MPWVIKVCCRGMNRWRRWLAVPMVLLVCLVGCTGGQGQSAASHPPDEEPSEVSTEPLGDIHPPKGKDMPE